jgi:hypothetical protein
LLQVVPQLAIDGVISLAMALGRCDQQPEPVRLLGWV